MPCRFTLFLYQFRLKQVIFEHTASRIAFNSRLYLHNADKSNGIKIAVIYTSVN